MAEFIEELRERLLPEYEQMRKLSICTDDQIRETMRKRDHLLNRIFQTPKAVADYVEFIRHEKLIHKWVGEKEKALNKNMTDLKHSIVTRIVRLYREGLRYFPHEIRLWDNFILFTKKSMPNEVSGIYDKMLAYHGDKASVWCESVLWIYENGSDMRKIKEIFFRALQRHPESESLNITFFDILLKEASKMSPVKTAQTASSEQQLGLERALLVYRNSRAKISNSVYYIKLLGRCEEDLYANLTIHIQKEIIDDMMMNFPRDEAVWDYLAQRELNGFSMIELKKLTQGENKKGSLLEQLIPNNLASSSMATISSPNSISVEGNVGIPRSSPPMTPSTIATTNVSETTTSATTTIPFEGKQEFTDDNEDIKEEKFTPTNDGCGEKPILWQKRTLKKRIELCIHVYQIGLRALQTTEMCTYYINAMLQLNQDLTNQANYKRKCLAIAFREGHISKLMSDEHYYACIKLLLKCPLGIDNATQLLTEATHLENSLMYYEMWMIVHMANNNTEKLKEVFEKANKILGVGKCVSLWRKMLNFLKTIPTNEENGVMKFMDFFKEAAMQFSHEFDSFRTEYLEYISTTQTLEATRKEYDELCQMPPPCLALHRKMAEIEMMAMVDVPENRSRLRKCYENATLQFGKCNTNVWIDYIKFERDHGEPKRMTHIYEKAKNCLSSRLVDDFIAEFTLLKAIV